MEYPLSKLNCVPDCLFSSARSELHGPFSILHHDASHPLLPSSPQGLSHGVLRGNDEVHPGDLHRLLPDAERRFYEDGEYLIRCRVWGVYVAMWNRTLRVR